MTEETFKKYVLRADQATSNDEKLFHILNGLIDLFSFKTASLFSYSELTRMVHGQFGINENRLYQIEDIHEQIDVFPPIRNILKDGKASTVHKLEDFRQIPANYFYGVYRFIVVPIQFKTMTVGFITATNLDNLLQVDNEQLHLLDAYADFVSKLSVNHQSNSDMHPLTRREHEVIRRVSWGESVKEIAEVLQISEYTVQDYVKSVIRKLNVKNRTEAVAQLIRKGIIE